MSLTPPLSERDIGKRFRTRGGGIARVTGKCPAVGWRVKWIAGPTFGLEWVYDNGRIYDSTDLIYERPYDLISRIEEPAMENQADMVNHPPHYTKSPIEAIEAIEAWELNFHRGNAVKYLARAQHKGSELQDLRKALWYLEREIQRLETK